MGVKLHTALSTVFFLTSFSMCRRNVPDTSSSSYLNTSCLRWDAEISLQRLSWLSFPFFFSFFFYWLRKWLIILVAVILFLFFFFYFFAVLQYDTAFTVKGFFPGSVLCTLSKQSSFFKGKWKRDVLEPFRKTASEIKTQPELLSPCRVEPTGWALHCGAFTDTPREKHYCAQHGTVSFESCFCQFIWCWKCFEPLKVTCAVWFLI